MTSKETLENTFDLDKYKMASGVHHQTEDAVIEAMQEYAKEKCKELLEIVVRQARISFSNNKANDFGIDKDSILNCVDLEKFCF